MVNTLGTMPEEVKIGYERNMLKRAVPKLAFYKGGKMASLSKNDGNSVNWRGVNISALNTTPLTEGVTPVATAMTIRSVTAQVQQYGTYTMLTDQVNMLAIDPLLSEFSSEMGENWGKTIDVITRNEVQTGTTVQYATGSTRAGQAASNVLTLAMLLKARATLMANDTPMFDGDTTDLTPNNGYFEVRIHPYAYMDLLNDTQIKAYIANNAGNQIAKSGSYPIIYGLKLMESSLCPVFTGAGSGGANVYATIINGRDAYGVVDVAGKGKGEMIVKPVGSGGSEDPLNQRGSVGWKANQAPKILYQERIVRLEHGATNG